MVQPFPLDRLPSDIGPRTGRLVELSEPSYACRLAAQVVALDGWVTVLPLLERIAPRAVATVADQMTS